MPLILDSCKYESFMRKGSPSWTYARSTMHKFLLYCQDIKFLNKTWPTKLNKVEVCGVLIYCERTYWEIWYKFWDFHVKARFTTLGPVFANQKLDFYRKLSLPKFSGTSRVVWEMQQAMVCTSGVVDSSMPMQTTHKISQLSTLKLLQHLQYY